MRTTNKDRFEIVLIEQYIYLFTLPEYERAADKWTPEELTKKMIAGLLDGTADKDGEGIKRTCKVLGIKHTYKTIKEFLNS